jgi:predicted Zn-ribbon and HTH transcriptional regulator
MTLPKQAPRVLCVSITKQQEVIMIDKKIIIITCKKCGYNWQARVEKPKSCPECKTRLWKEYNKTQKEN